MANDNEKDLKNRAEREKPEISPEIKPEKPENLSEVLEEGKNDIKTIKLQVREVISGEKDAIEKEGNCPDQVKKFKEGEENLEKGVGRAEGKLTGDLEIIKGELENKESLLTETMEKLNEKEYEIERIKVNLRELLNEKESVDRNEKLGNIKEYLSSCEKELKELGDKVREIIANAKKDSDSTKKEEKDVPLASDLKGIKEEKKPNTEKTEEEAAAIKENLLFRRKGIKERLLVVDDYFIKAGETNEDLNALFKEYNRAFSKTKEWQNTEFIEVIDRLDKGLHKVESDIKDREKGNEKSDSIINAEIKEDMEIKKEDFLKNSEDKFNSAYSELGRYNQTIPNWFKDQSDGLTELVDKLRESNFDKETTDFLSKAIVKNRSTMIDIMNRRENVQLYDFNQGNDQGAHEIKIDAYLDLIKDQNIKAVNLREQLSKIDKDLTSAWNKFDSGVFTSEYSNAKSFIEIAENTKNTKEQQANLVIAKHILDNIKKGMEDKELTKALGDKRSNIEEKSAVKSSLEEKEKVILIEKDIDLEKLPESLGKEMINKIKKELQNKESPLSKARQEIKSIKFETGGIKDLIKENETRLEKTMKGLIVIRDEEIKKRSIKNTEEYIEKHKQKLREKEAMLKDTENKVKETISKL